MSPCGRHPQWVHDSADCPFCTALPRSLVDIAIQRIHDDRMLNEAEQRAVVAEVEQLRRDAWLLKNFIKEFAGVLTDTDDWRGSLHDARQAVVAKLEAVNAEVEDLRRRTFCPDHNGECTNCDEWADQHTVEDPRKPKGD